MRFKQQQAIDLRHTDSIARVNKAKALSQPKETKSHHWSSLTLEEARNLGVE